MALASERWLQRLSKKDCCVPSCCDFSDKSIYKFSPIPAYDRTNLPAARIHRNMFDIAGFSPVADFPTDSGRPTAVYIHDVPIASVAVVISDVNFDALL